MGDFPAIPTKEELYQKVNEWFYATNPDAPEPLDPTSSEHAEWRRDWLRYRDELLNAETNRIYWEAYPDAPHEIDPSNPDHKPYEKAWLDIRSWILDMTPDMAPADPDDLARAQDAALEYVYTGFGEQVEGLQKVLPQDLYLPLSEAAGNAGEAVGVAYRNGLIGEDTWEGQTVDLTSTEDSTKGVKLMPRARVEKGSVNTWFETELRGVTP